MSEMSYISVIERYHEYRDAIRELLAAIVTGVGDKRLCNDDAALANAISSITDHYPFVDHIYLLDDSGKQISPIINKHGKSVSGTHEKGTDRSQRPYFKKAKKHDFCN